MDYFFWYLFVDRSKRKRRTNKRSSGIAAKRRNFQFNQEKNVPEDQNEAESEEEPSENHVPNTAFTEGGSTQDSSLEENGNVLQAVWVQSHLWNRRLMSSWLQAGSCAACSRWPCFGRRVGLDDPQRSLPTRTILWFCGSVFVCVCERERWDKMSRFLMKFVWETVKRSAFRRKIKFCLFKCLRKESHSHQQPVVWVRLWTKNGWMLPCRAT